MIDFACKEFKISEIIKCSFGLSKSDYNLFNYFLKNKDQWYRTNKLAKKLKLNLTTVQRSVKKLHEKKILERRQKNLDKGGYIYLYKIEKKNKIRSKILSIIHSWIRRVEEELEKL
jgi:predicted transcriptional regulator